MWIEFEGNGGSQKKLDIGKTGQKKFIWNIFFTAWVISPYQMTVAG